MTVLKSSCACPSPHYTSVNCISSKLHMKENFTTLDIHNHWPDTLYSVLEFWLTEIKTFSIDELHTVSVVMIVVITGSKITGIQDHQLSIPGLQYWVIRLSNDISAYNHAIVITCMWWTRLPCTAQCWILDPSNHAILFGTKVSYLYTELVRVVR